MPAKGRGHLTGRTCDACIIEDNDFALLGEAVKDGRIPIVQISVEVVVENKWQPAPLPQRRYANECCLPQQTPSGRNCCMSAHGASSFSLWLKIGDF